jgi:hypothetical protein
MDVWFILFFYNGDKVLEPLAYCNCLRVYPGFNILKSNGNYVPAALIVSNSVFLYDSQRKQRLFFEQH